AVESKKIKVTFNDQGVVEKALDTALVPNVATDVKITYKDREYTVSVTYNAPDVSVAAVGASKIEVKFNKAVDTTAAKIEVKRGAAVVNVSTTTPSAEKTSIVLNLTSRMIKGDYTVTVSVLTAEPVTQNITVDDEKVTKLELNNDTAAAVFTDTDSDPATPE